jgi:hypothetical protein
MLCVFGSEWNEALWTSLFDALLNQPEPESMFPFAELRLQLCAHLLTAHSNAAKQLKVWFCCLVIWEFRIHILFYFLFLFLFFFSHFSSGFGLSLLTLNIC